VLPNRGRSMAILQCAAGGTWPSARSVALGPLHGPGPVCKQSGAASGIGGALLGMNRGSAQAADGFADAVGGLARAIKEKLKTYYAWGLYSPPRRGRFNA
jgi:hypothetical protein